MSTDTDELTCRGCGCAIAEHLDRDAGKLTCPPIEAPKNLVEIGAEAMRIAIDRGWHEPRDIDGVTRDSSFPERLLMIHSEITEALEHWRQSGMGAWFEVDGKPEGVVFELADIVIRVCETAARAGMDLDEAVAIKMRFNERRPIRHGGKPL